MRLFSSAAVAAVSLGCVFSGVSLVAQTSLHSVHKLPTQYQDSETGAVRPMVAVAPEPATTPVGGTIQVVATITLKTPLPTGGSIICLSSVDATSFSLTTGAATIFSEESSVLAKVVGATATCTINTPYSWLIPPASTTVQNSLNGNYTIEMIGPVSSTTNPLSALTRSSTSTFVSLKSIPLTGTTSKYTIAVTL
jgi:hypothetical protein